MRSWADRPGAEPTPDVLIVGGGVIGCSLAYFLAHAGASVLLLERKRLAAGASGVAAGMLAPQVEAPFADAFFDLCLQGRAEHGPLAERLRDEVGLDIEHRAMGILRVARTESERTDLQRQQRWQTARGLRAEWFEPSELGTIEPLLAGVAGRLLAGGLWLPDEAQVRSPRLVHALATAAIARGARVREATWATSLEVSGRRAIGVRTPTGVVRGETVVLAAGVWSADLAQTIGLRLPVGPVKGQILSVRAAGAARQPRQVLWGGECYLVPRPDGEIVLGATEEEGSYDARPTLAGLHTLTEAALEIVPAVSSFVVEGAWGGLRPAAPDRRPIIGWAPEVESLMLVTAHYRNGVLLGPLTGRVLAHQILGDAGEDMDAVDALAPFTPQRFLSQRNEADA